MIPRCSWCGIPNPAHEGGAERRNGESIRGNFCNQDCFDNWIHAHSLIDITTMGDFQ